MPTIADFVTRNARRMPERPALVWRGRTSSWAELDERINRLANALLDRGLSPGGRVATVLDNCREWVEIHFACARIGAAQVPIMPSSVGREISHIVNDVGAEALVIGEGREETAEQVRGELRSVEIALSLGSPYRGAIAYEDALGAAAAAPPEIAVADDAVAIIKYTSGTTGLPKGCVRSHRQSVLAAILYQAHLHHCEQDRATISSPLSAGFAGALLNTFVLAGTTTYLLPKFDPALLLATIEREQITLAYAIQSTFNEFTRHPDLERHDLASLRLFTGTSASQDTLHGLQRLRRHPTFHAGLFNAYGSTEAGGYIAYNMPADYEEALSDPALTARVESIGREGFLCRVDCVDEAMAPLPPGAVGELAVRSPLVFAGYWNRPDETAAVFRNGWLVTGDMAWRDERGFLYLAGRKRDMIKTGGINVYPAEIEAVLAGHPKVAEAAVVGLPDPQWGEKVVACIIARAPVTETELLAFCAERLAGYKKPKAIRFLDDLPRNETGKIVKRTLRDLLDK